MKTKLMNTFILIAAVFFVSGEVLAQGSNMAERFSDYDANSKIKINHQPLTDYLQATVMPVGRSWRIMGEEKPETYRGSRIKNAKNLNPSRFEGSRLLVSFFVDGHKDFFKAYQEGLERLSNRRPLREFNKDEQLAFWLNLYNVVVINKVIAEYPIQKTKSFRSTRSGKTAFWDEKVTTIEGVPLSLMDIEKIIFMNFDLPEAAFGLWQGSVGGPRLQNYAYTGRNVKRALEINALEFVNSNRGLRPPTGTSMAVSDYYAWTRAAFGSNDAAVLGFIKEYADPNFVQGVSGVTSIKYKIYDWKVADLVGGSQHGGVHNQLGGVQTAVGVAGGGNRTGEGTFFGGPSVGITGNSNFAGKVETFGGHETQRVVFNVLGNLKMILDKQPTGPLETLPDEAFELMMGIKANTRPPRTIVTSVECAPDEDCVIENVDDPGA